MVVVVGGGLIVIPDLFGKAGTDPVPLARWAKVNKGEYICDAGLCPVRPKLGIQLVSDSELGVRIPNTVVDLGCLKAWLSGLRDCAWNGVAAHCLASTKIPVDAVADRCHVFALAPRTAIEPKPASRTGPCPAPTNKIW